MSNMTSIFGTVTAEVADDLINKFPSDFDFSSMMEKVSEDAGVILLVSGSGHGYKFQGLWISMEKVYDSLASALVVYGVSVGSPTENSTIKNESKLANGNYEAQTRELSQNHSSKRNSKFENNKQDNLSAIIESREQYKTINLDVISQSRVDNMLTKCKVNEETELSTQRTLRTRLNTMKSDATKISRKMCKTKVPLQSNKDKVKHLNGESQILSKSQNVTRKTNSNTQIVKKRKRGRPKKNVQTTSLKVVKQKIYKYTNYKSNFVRRPFSIRPIRKSKDIEAARFAESLSENEYLPYDHEVDADVEDDDTANDADVTKEDFHDEDCADKQKLTLHTKKRGRGRPKRTEKKSFPCAECDFVAESTNMLNDHKHRTHRACPTKCDVCLKIFPNKRYMMRHRASHVEPQHCCDICGKMYKVKKSMEEHRKTHDAGYTKPIFDCSQCSKTFCNGYVLKCHIKSEHLGEKKSFLCSRCGKSFTTKHSLQEHSNAHTGLKPHICDICGKGFNYESALRDHKYTHTEIRKFSCTECNKHFCQRSSLKMHMRIHAKDKKFVCEDCGRGFTQKQALQRHERVHKGFKPFVCKLCRRTFTDSSIIRRHLILVHKIHKDSNSWREDIICKIGPTKFRVEKIDTMKLNDDEEQNDVEEEMIEALPIIQTQTVADHSYSTKDNLDYNNIEQGVVLQVDEISTDNNNTLLLSPLSSTAQPMELSQVIDYSERNTNSVTSIQSSQGMIPDSSHIGLAEGGAPDIHISSPIVWGIPVTIREQQNHLSVHNQHHIQQEHQQTQQHHHTTAHLQQQEVPVQIDHGSTDLQDYQNQQSAHLQRSATPQYLPVHEIDNQMRCSSVNYPNDVRHDIHTDPNHNTGTQWPSIYAYYSQLASQFGMNLNEYSASGYIHPQGSLSPHHQQQQQ